MDVLLTTFVLSTYKWRRNADRLPVTASDWGSWRTKGASCRRGGKSPNYELICLLCPWLCKLWKNIFSTSVAESYVKQWLLIKTTREVVYRYSLLVSIQYKGRFYLDGWSSNGGSVPYWGRGPLASPWSRHYRLQNSQYRKNKAGQPLVETFLNISVIFR